MGELSVLHVDRLVRPAVVQEIEARGPIGMPRSELEGPSSSSVPPQEEVVMMDEEDEGQHNEKAPLIALAECRICQEEDSLNNLETPCLCSGSLKVKMVSGPSFYLSNIVRKFCFFMRRQS